MTESRIIYGEQSVITLTKRLKLDCRPTVEQFRKLQDGKQPESHIKDFSFRDKKFIQKFERGHPERGR